MEKQNNTTFPDVLYHFKKFPAY